MRIAISGTHRVGKSTLVEALATHLPTYAAIEEVYASLEEDGYEFSDPPTVEDFEAQLEKSIELAHELPPDAIVDRCPLDYVAYLYALDEAWDIDPWLDALRDVMGKFDVVVLVRIGRRDRFVPTSSDDARLRAEVDERIRSVVLGSEASRDIDVLEVSGSDEARVRQVLDAMRS